MGINDVVRGSQSQHNNFDILSKETASVNERRLQVAQQSFNDDPR